MDAPNRYDDPYYAQLAAATEQKLGLPSGLLSAIVTKGEKSNADQVSDAGARTVFQITPQTRKLVLDRDGIDAYLSPENAAEVAGLVAKDGVNWAKSRTQDPAAIERLAAGYYHAGGDTSNWGAKTNAYIARVSGGIKDAKADSLATDFAKFMEANPAVPPDSQRPQSNQPAAPIDAISQDFGAWKAQQDAAPPPPPEPSAMDKLVGAGEAALSTATGAIPGYAGAVGGWLAGAAKTLVEPAGGDHTQAYSDAAANALTYAPRTASGQQQAAAVGDLINNVAVPIAGLAPELAILHEGLAPTATAARAPAAPVVNTLQRAAGAIPDVARGAVNKVASVVGHGDETPPVPTPGTMGSAGAAGTDMAAQRTANAESLPVPIKLTVGQATRDYAQQRFEQETAKDPTNGQPLRDRYAQQNEDIPKNFDRMIDQTGAETVAPSDVGRAVVDDALVKDAAAKKAEYRIKYQQAEKAGELEEPVSLQPLIDHLNESAPEATTAPLIDTARKLAIKLGIAQDDGSGNLIAKPIEAPAPPPPAGGSLMGGAPKPAVMEPGVSLKTAEQFRQAINRNTDFEPTNVRQATIMKSLIDQATDGMGGDLYQQARKARQRYAQLYEDNSVVSDLLNNRKGTADRKVALENVFNRTVLNGSREDLGNLRRTLHVSGSDAGKQAWKELQGATLRHINDESTKGVATDIRGNPIVSPARLNNVIRSLDKGGKLDFVLGKQGAQTVRDLNDLAKVVYTSPPGSVNHSNTASVILAALAEAGVSGSMTGLPVPVLSGLRILAMRVKDKRIQQRVAAALGEAKAKEATTSRVARTAKTAAETVH